MFKIGDRVIVKGIHELSGRMGTVVLLPDSTGDESYIRKGYGIEFDEPHSLLHSCRGKTKKDCGAWVKPECLELINPKAEKIVITRDGKTTLARLYEDNKVVKSAEANCDQRDEFKFIEGAKIALERLTEEEPPKFDKSMLTNGRFGCASDGDWFVVVGDKLIYERGNFDYLSVMNDEGKYPSGHRVKYVVEADSFGLARRCAKVIWRASDFKKGGDEAI